MSPSSRRRIGGSTLSPSVVSRVPPGSRPPPPVSRASIALRLASIALLFTSIAPPLAAQEAARSGFSAELGGGLFLSRVACTGCEVTRTSSGGGFFRVGVALNGRVMLAIESMGQSTESLGPGAEDEDLLVEKVNLSAIVLWFPWRSGIFAKAGFGTASGTVTVDPSGTDPLETSGTGVGITTGVGLDLPITGQLSLSLNVGAWVSALGDVVLPNRIVDDVIDSTYAFTLGVTLR